MNVEDNIYHNINNINNNDKGINYFQMHELSISNSENDDNKPLFNWNINMKPTKNLLGTIPLTNTKISGMNTSGVDLANCCTNPSYPSKFDPKSDRWVRVNLFQGAPLKNELNDLKKDDWWMPTLKYS